MSGMLSTASSPRSNEQHTPGTPPPHRPVKIGVLSAVLIAIFGAAVSVNAQTSGAVTAFVNVTVVPMDRDRLLARHTVLVRGDRIVALGPTADVPIPSDAVQIDGRDKFLIPGLADMHAHIGIEATFNGDTLNAHDRLQTERMLFLYAAAGVTTIRNMHGVADVLALRARIAAGQLLGPRMYVATPMISTSSATINGVALDSAVK